MATHEILASRLFWQTVRVPFRNRRFISRGSSTMTEPPFHHAEPVVIRIPFTNWAIVIGVWRATGWTEEDALLNALTGWGFDPFDDVADPDQEEVNQRVREAVSANVDDIDEEWRIISALGAAD